jgi:cellobiose phosphorylase
MVLLPVYSLLENNGTFSLMLHPSDSLTGVRYSILPMNRGILSGLFSTAQANQHLQIIRENLLGPDGERLMDKTAGI